MTARRDFPRSEEPKRCSTCGETKPAEQFDADKRVRCGLQARCKECMATRHRAWKARAAFPRSTEPKACAQCGETKPADDFPSDRRLRDGLHSHCRTCVAVQWKNGKKHRPGYHKEYAAANPEKMLAKERRRDRKEYARQRYQENREESLAKAREWGRRHPERKVVTQANYRARATGAGGSYTLEEWEDLKSKYGGKCLRCGRTDRPLQGDHVIPISKGGTGDIGNIQPLCGPCNTGKLNRSTDYRPQHG